MSSTVDHLLMSKARRLTRTLLHRTTGVPAQVSHMREDVDVDLLYVTAISATNPFTLTVAQDASSPPLASGVPALDGYDAQVGDWCFCLKRGTQLVAVGTRSYGGATYFDTSSTLAQTSVAFGASPVTGTSSYITVTKPGRYAVNAGIVMQGTSGDRAGLSIVVPNGTGGVSSFIATVTNSAAGPSTPRSLVISRNIPLSAGTKLALQYFNHSAANAMTFCVGTGDGINNWFTISYVGPTR